MTQLDIIEAFRLDYLTGAFDFSVPPPLAIHDDTHDDTTSNFSSDRRSSFLSTTVASTLQDIDENAYRLARERGIQAEQNIERSLKEKHLLLKHGDFEPLVSVVKKVLHKLRTSGKGKEVMYVDCGLLRVETGKLSISEMDSQRLVLRWDHLSLLPLLFSIPNLTLSHKVSIYLSTDSTTSLYSEKEIALRTNLAWVEHHLFVLLPGWLEAVTVRELEEFERRKEELEAEKRKKMATPGLANNFLDRLKASPTTPSQSIIRQRQRSPLRRELVNYLPSLTFLEKLHGHGSKPLLPDLRTLPPLLDQQDDEDLSEIFGRKLIF